MVRIRRFLGIWCLVGLAAGLWLGCASKSPEDKVAEIRSLYSARMNGFIIEEEPIYVEEPVVEQVDPEAGDEDVVVEELEPVAVETKQNARLDLLIQHDSYDRLPGVTVEISMANSAGEEKGHWRVWFDTAEISKASVTQFTHILEDIAYEEGDGFFAEVRNPIPVEERSEYREFAEASGDN